MRRFFATMMIAAIGTTAVGSGMALAADLEVTPATPEAGEAELTIDVTDFDPDTPIYAIPCEIPADGAELDVTTDNCDIAEVVTATTDSDGNATIVVTWDIPAGGIAVYVGDEARGHEATQILTPPAADDDAGDNSDVAVLGTNVVQEDLADTGPREVVILLTVATSLIGFGFALTGTERLRTAR